MPDKLNYHHIFVAQQPIFKQYCQIYCPIKYSYIVGNVAENMIRWSVNSIVDAYVSEESMLHMREDGKKLLDANFANEILNEMSDVIKEYWQIAENTREICLKNPGKNDLLTCCKQFNEIMFKIFAYFIVSTQSVTYAIEEKIKQIIKQQYSDENEINDIFITLITPSEEDLLYKEKTFWISVLKSPMQENIQRYTLTFPFLFCNIDSEEDVYLLQNQRIHENNVDKIEAELKNTKKRLLLLKNKQQVILYKINSTDLKTLSITMQKLALSRLDLKACWSGCHFYLMPFFKQLANLAKTELRNIMMFYTTEDMINLVQNNQPLSREELNNRKEAYLFVKQQNKVIFFSGEKAKLARQESLDPFLPTTNNITTFKGTIANKGKVIGIVKLVKVDDLREIIKIAKSLDRNRKQIIVTGMTNPNMIPIIDKVAGIITDEGGMACHAAIISRERNVPCIVGCRIATDILTDGDEIELNADDGIVTIIKLN